MYNSSKQSFEDVRISNSCLMSSAGWTLRKR